MLRQRLQAKAIRQRMLREHRARPPEPPDREPEKPPDDEVAERQPVRG